jgi:hypothetical protein
MNSLLIAILGAATLSLSAGCAVAGTGETDLDEAEQALQFDVVTLSSEAACTGVWVAEEGPCVCPPIGHPGYTTECTALDCAQTEIYALADEGGALHVTVRATAQQEHLSAIGFDADLGTWEADGAELALSLESGQATYQAECGAAEMTMKEKLMKPASAALVRSILWAWNRDQWIDVPYQP